MLELPCKDRKAEIGCRLMLLVLLLPLMFIVNQL